MSRRFVQNFSSASAFSRCKARCSSIVTIGDPGVNTSEVLAVRLGVYAICQVGQPLMQRGPKRDAIRDRHGLRYGTKASDVIDAHWTAVS